MNFARLVVRETHGLRRFLYPLTTQIRLPNTITPQTLGLVTADGQSVPLQISPIEETEQGWWRVDFAISIAPFATMDLLLSNDATPIIVNDPLQVVEDGGYRSTQQRFQTDILAGIDAVVYDGVSHLHGQSVIMRNGEALFLPSYSGWTGNTLLAAWAIAEGKYLDGCEATTRTELTACKSWATITHTLEAPKADDVVTFTLPLTVNAFPLLCDFGTGGGIYGKMGEGDTVRWETHFPAPLELGAGGASWTLATNGRTDYAGIVGSREEYHAQQWFHVMDKSKALAVAITHLPNSCRQLTVTLNSTGDVQIAFTLGDVEDGPTEFGVCYHFLNDAPAIAAATNPQSILLPPTVEVLPA